MFLFKIARTLQSILFIWLLITNCNLFLDMFKQDQIIFLNIGQGDATLICKQKSVCGLIDTGKNSIILDEIKRKTSKSLEFLIITHPDKDHSDKIIDLIKDIGVKMIFINESVHSKDLILTIKNQSAGTKIFSLFSYNDFIFDKFDFDILWPTKEFPLSSIDSNDTSIAILIKYNKKDILFLAGDLSYKFEDKIINIYNLKDIPAIKAGHHGSKTSTSSFLIQKLNPSIAILSYGKNSYGHPHPEVIKRLIEKKVEYIETYKDSNILMELNSNQIKITGENGKKSFIILN